MKKKWLNKLSTIFGVFGLCGAFALSSLLDHKQKPEEANAEGTVLVNSYTGSIGYPIWQSYTIEGESYGFTGSYYVAVYRNLVDTYKYTYTYNLILNRITLIGDYYDGYYVELFDDNNQPYTFSLSLKTDLELPYLVFSSNFIQGYTADHQMRFQNMLFPSSYRSQLGITNDNTVFIPASSGQMSFINVLKVYDSSSNEIVDENGRVDVLRKVNNLATQEQYYLIFQQVNVSTVNTESDEYASGYNVGYSDGYNTGFSDGSESGYAQGQQEQLQQDQLQFDDYYQQGYTAGYQAGSNEDATVTSIFGGIATVAMVPVNFFLSIFNFEILGVNIAAVVSALLSICIIIIVWRTVMGGKGND